MRLLAGLLTLALVGCGTTIVQPDETDCPPVADEPEDLGDDPCGVEGSKINFEGDCACLLDCPEKPGCARRECTLEGIDTDAYWGTCSWSECEVR